MTRVILSPTWKYLSDTVSWPEKPIEEWTGSRHNYGGFTYGYQMAMKNYESALTEASRHLVDIAEEDWETVRILSVNERGITASYSKLTQLKNGAWQVKPDTPYTIDAEFEVVEQWRRKSADITRENSNQWEDFTPPTATKQSFNEYRQIARLVKPKEKQNNDMKDPIETGERATATNTTFPDFKKYTLLNPTDSVTSDGTKPKEVKEYVLTGVDNRPRFTEASKSRMREWTEGERRDAINYLHELNGQSNKKAQPTETQDELWSRDEVIEIIRKLREELIGHCKPWYNACRSIETDCNWVIENLNRK